MNNKFLLILFYLLIYHQYATAAYTDCVQDHKTMEQIYSDCKHDIDKSAYTYDQRAYAAWNAGTIGELMKRPFNEVLGLYLIAISKGHTSAYYNIGDLYYNGYDNTTPNYNKAIKYFNKISETSENYGDVLFKFSEMSLNGLGFTKNYKKAEDYLLESLKLPRHKIFNKYSLHFDKASNFYDKNQDKNSSNKLKTYFWRYVAYATATEPTLKGGWFQSLEELSIGVSKKHIEKIDKMIQSCVGDTLILEANQEYSRIGIRCLLTWAVHEAYFK